MDAMILAAGRGARLRPLTDSVPKPLLEISGLSLIEIHLHSLARAGFSRIIINLHHLGALIRSKLGNGGQYGLEIFYSEESGEALETAGGIQHALHLIKSDHFAVISADILCDYPIDAICETLTDDHLGHLVLVDNPLHHPNGDFLLNPENATLSYEAITASQKYTYSGIAYFDKALFLNQKPGKLALRPVLEKAIAEQRIKGERYTGLWSDIGTLDRLESARHSTQFCSYIESIKQSTN